MARELCITWTGRRRSGPWESLCADYRSRIERDLPVRDIVLRPESSKDLERRMQLEAEAVRKRLPEPTWLVVLDRSGRSYSSQDLANWLGRRIEEWPHAISFVIGSDVGLDVDLVKAARTRLSLGALTLPHQLARLILYEQLYRALSILNGIKYHRQPLST